MYSYIRGINGVQVKQYSPSRLGCVFSLSPYPKVVRDRNTRCYNVLSRNTPTGALWKNKGTVSIADDPVWSVSPCGVAHTFVLVYLYPMNNLTGL